MGLAGMEIEPVELRHGIAFGGREDHRPALSGGEVEGIVGPAAGNIGLQHDMQCKARCRGCDGEGAVLARRDVERQAGGFEIERLRPLKEDMVVAKVKGLSDRDAAGALTGVSLFVARDKLPPPDEDEFYIADLVGLAAVSPEGEQIGVVKNVLNFGASDILEIAPAAGETLMLPFTKEVAPSIDFASGKIIVVQPAETE